MLKIIVLVLVVVIGAIAILATTQPDTFHVERSVRINAAPPAVFAVINDFHQWGAWSPWEKLDPAMKRTFSGPPAGKGAVYEWDGNSKAGQGRMEIAQSTPAEQVLIDLDFIKPIAGHAVTAFTLREDSGATEVSWKIDGPSAYISKVMGLFVSMDSMIGRDFDSGLARMKAVTEQSKP